MLSHKRIATIKELHVAQHQVNPTRGNRGQEKKETLATVGGGSGDAAFSLKGISMCSFSSYSSHFIIHAFVLSCGKKFYLENKDGKNYLHYFNC
jgi:hypothetical protein